MMMNGNTSLLKQITSGSRSAFFLLPLYLVLGDSTPLFAKPPIDSEIVSTGQTSQRYNIINIEVEVSDWQNTPLDKNEINKVLSIMESKRDHPYFPHILDKDLKKISQSYEVVSSALKESSKGYTLQLSVRKRQRISEIVFEGSKQLSSKLFTDLPVASGDLYDRASVLSAQRKLIDIYRKKGYSSVSISHTLQPSIKQGQVDLRFDIQEGVFSAITQVNFIGISKNDASQLRKNLITRERTFFRYLTSTGGWYVEEGLEHDLLSITRAMQAKGYVDAVVDPRIESTDTGLKITFYVTPGPQYFLGNFVVDLALSDYPFTDRQVLQIAQFKKGSVYSPEELALGSERLATFLGIKGYTAARVSITPRIDEADPQKVDLHFTVISGEKSHVGLVHFSGNHVTKPRVVLHELLLVPGGVLDTKALSVSEKRLLNTQLFSKVHITTRDSEQPLDDLKNYKDIVVDLEEKDGVGKFAFSFGASSTDLGYIAFEIAEPNFNSQGFSQIPRKGISALRGNGEYISAKVNISQKSLLHDIKWTYPYLFESPWTFSLKLDKGNHREQASYDLNRQGITLQFFHSPRSHSQISLYTSLRHDTVKIRAPESDAVTDAIRDQENFNGPKATIGTGYQIQKIDHPIFPTRGLRSKSDLALSRILNKNITYAHLSQESSLYIPLFAKSTLKLRGDLHAVIPFGSVDANSMPISTKLLLGGDGNMRGFSNQSLGGSYINGHPQGGLTLCYGSVEFLYKFFPEAGFFIFSDNGMVSEGRVTFNTPYHSLGYGVRLSLMGRFPLSIGMGYPLKVDHSTQESNFFFELGGHF